MKIFFKLIVGIAMLSALPVLAQVYKCKNTAGKIEYQQKPCPGVGTIISTPQQTAPSKRSAPAEQNPDARRLTSLIAAALSERDFQRAESLAVTAEHHAMINKARHFDPNTCKFRHYAYGDELGKTLSAAAKEECLSTNGQLGPAYVRWRDHYQTESARRSGIVGANRPNRSMTCKPNYLGGLECN